MPNIQQIMDGKAVLAGLGTAGTGVYITLSGVQTMLGIIAAAAGIVLTVFTFYWRRKEHKHRMKQVKKEAKETIKVVKKDCEDKD